MTINIVTFKLAYLCVLHKFVSGRIFVICSDVEHFTKQISVVLSMYICTMDVRNFMLFYVVMF